MAVGIHCSGRRCLDRYCSNRRHAAKARVGGFQIQTAPSHILVRGDSLTILFSIILFLAILSSGMSAGLVQAETLRKSIDEPVYGTDATVAMINQYIRQGWTDNELKPAVVATDGEWLRRVFLDLIGRIPSIEELDAFVSDKDKAKKAKIIDRLLGEEYVEEYARNWTTIWTNTLIGRTGGTTRRTLISRPGMQKYLRDSFHRNKPYDRMVAELVTATGNTTPGEEGFNGATNFLVEKLDENGVQATAKTAQIFLGLQVQCTQCHNHPFNDGKQNQFWEMNAFFRQTRPLRAFDGRDIANVRLIDQDFSGEGGKPEEAELFYELRNGKLSVAYPVFVDGTSLVSLKGEASGNSGYVEDINRRQELSKLMLESRYLDRTIVNRIWSHFLGYGFTKPVDDMGPHNPPTHPELLDKLSQAHREAGFDLKELMRWITLSEAYSLSSRMTKHNERDDPTLGERPMFSHFYLRQMQAEQLYESMLVATEDSETNTGTPQEQEQRKRRWLGQFARAFGTDEGDESTTFNGTIPQALMMMNGEMVQNAIQLKNGCFLCNLAEDEKKSGTQKIQHLYKAAFARTPSPRELKTAHQVLALREGNGPEAMRDIFWALLNSNEFILNH